MEASGASHGMNTEQPSSEATDPSLPRGAAPDDHPGWRLAFRLVDLGADETDWRPYIKITIWGCILLTLIGATIWLAGPWVGLGGGGAYGLAKATRAVRRKRQRRRQITKPSTPLREIKTPPTSPQRGRETG